MGLSTLKARLRRIERVVVAGDDLPGALIMSVRSGRLDAPPRDDERDCIGLLSTCGASWKKIVRRPGEPLAAMDRRAEIGEGDSIPCWIRVYSDGDEPERLELFATVPEVGLPP